MNTHQPLNNHSLTQRFNGSDTYEVIATIYEDSLYITHLVTARSTGQRFMLRTLNGNQGEFHVNSLRRAATALRNLSSPHIAKIHDVGNTPNNDNIFIVMEAIEGLPLTGWIEDAEVNEFMALRFLRQLALALKELERHAKPHGSIQPSSIFVCPSASNREEALLKIWDLGLAKIGDAGIAFEAPEQVSDADIRLDIRADIYSIGAVIYRLLTGRSPYEAQTRGRLAMMVSSHHEQPASLSALRSDLSADTVQLIERCMSKEPSRRYQTTAELITATERLLGGQEDRISFLHRQAESAFNQSEWMEVIRIYEEAKQLNGGVSGKRQLKALANKAEKVLAESAGFNIESSIERARTMLRDYRLRAAEQQFIQARRTLSTVEQYLERPDLIDALAEVEEELKQAHRFQPAYLQSMMTDSVYGLDLPQMVIGRSHLTHHLPDNGLDLAKEPQSRSVSRKSHAELFFNDGVWKVRHGGNPRNVTRLNGKVVESYEGAVVREQDQLEFGKVSLIFRMR